MKYPAPSYTNVPRHNDNVSRAKAGADLAEKNSPRAGAVLGSSTSEAKGAAAEKNGQKGGRPVGS